MDVSNLCRTCMKDLAVWENNFNENTLQMFTFCTSIEVLEDQLPQKFCGQCTTAIESCCTFITTARNVDTKLKEIVTTFTAIKPEITDGSIQLRDFHELDTKTYSDNDNADDALDINQELVLKSVKTEPENDVNEKGKNKILLKRTRNQKKRYKGTKLLRIKPLSHKACMQMTKSKYKSDLQCPFCGRVFLRKRLALKQHIADHLKKLKYTEATPKSRVQVDQTLDMYSQSFICAVCHKGYARKKNYEKHMLGFHSNAKSKEGAVAASMDTNVCFMCDKSFISNTDLLEHLEAHFRYPCMFCSKTFTSSPELNRHKKSEHSGRRYDCPHCTLTFAKRSLHTAHVRTHVGAISPQIAQLRFVCDYCKKSFRFKSDLRLHLHIHDTTLKSVLCDICGSRFSFKRALRDHRRVHTGEKPFKCEECGYTCATSSNMSRHVRAHKGERNHQCVQCGKAFKEASSLKKHMFWHTGERPYKCPHCERCYVNSSKRKIHLVRAHGMDPSEIPRMAKDGGPARRYVTSEARSKPAYSLLKQRMKKSHSEVNVEKNNLPDT